MKKGGVRNGIEKKEWNVIFIARLLTYNTHAREGQSKASRMEFQTIFFFFLGASSWRERESAFLFFGCKSFFFFPLFLSWIFPSFFSCLWLLLLLSGKTLSWEGWSAGPARVIIQTRLGKRQQEQLAAPSSSAAQPKGWKGSPERKALAYGLAVGNKRALPSSEGTHYVSCFYQPESTTIHTRRHRFRWNAKREDGRDFDVSHRPFPQWR